MVPGTSEHRHPFDLSGLTVVVTGGNRGIGLGLARGVARCGASVCLWARSAERNSQAVQELRNLGANASAVQCDVVDESSVSAAMEMTIRDHGRVDALFANAGILGTGYRFVDMPLGEWQQVIETNLDGAFLCLREAARHMTAAGHPGSLVCVSSTSAIHGAPRREHYASSKAALLALMRGLAVELAPVSIRCNAILPGWTETEMFSSSATGRLKSRAHQRLVEATTRRTPVRRWAKASDFESVAAFLADPSISYHTGDALVVDGGYTIF